MAAKRSPATERLNRNRLKMRQDVARAFRFCLTSTHTSRDAAADVLGVSKRTVDTWLRCESAITVEIILASELGGEFRRELCTADHSHDAPPSIAKRRSAK